MLSLIYAQPEKNRAPRGAWLALLLLPGLLHALPPKAEDKLVADGLSFEACSMITSEYLTVVQLYQTGLTSQQLQESLPGITDKGKERVAELYQVLEKNGVVETYSNINARYARCGKKVYKARGAPAPGSRERHFYFCAGENKLRYEIALAAWAGGKPEQILPQVPKERRHIARNLIAMEDQKGIEEVFHSMATDLKHCLTGIR